MAPRRRTNDKYLPPRVYKKHGAFYFVDHNYKWHKLGSTLSQAMQTWSNLKEVPTASIKMNTIFDRYMREVAPQKAPRSFKDNTYQIANLRVFFGAMRADQITPVDIYHYQDLRSKKARVQANREKSLLSHVFSMAIKWGIVATNPCREVKRLKETPRDRYITDQEFLVVRELASPLIRCVMDFAYITGQRQGDILRVKFADMTDEGIIMKVNKVNKTILIEWSEELKIIINEAKALPRKISGLYLFYNQKGQPYTTSGFKALWQRVMDEAIKSNVISERFTFNDIRSKAATDAEKLGGLEYARKLLVHSTSKTTSRVYVRGIQKVKPLK